MSEMIIRFSHRGYGKLKGIDLCAPVRLLEVFQKHEKDLHPVFRGYDTEYSVVEMGMLKIGYYSLPSAPLLALLFEDKAGKVFTTLRRMTEEKLKYYLKQRGEYFKVVFDNGAD